MPHREAFHVRSYEVDPRERLTPRALCGYLQEAAGIHAAALGASMARLREAGLAWVLHRLRVEMEEPPRQGEAVEVVTWPSRFDRVVADREFEVFDQRGRRLAAATSRWAVVDMGIRGLGAEPRSGVSPQGPSAGIHSRREPPKARPVRMPEFILAIGGEDRPAPVSLTRGELPAVSEPAVEKAFAVRRSDLDVVRHVNNTQYVGWLLETVPDEVEAELRPAALELIFHREAVYGDLVRSAAQPLPAEAGRAYAHVLCHGGEGHELVRAVSVWV